jgi:hypothetical protein
MQEAERAVFQQGSVTWKKSKDSISLDIKSLLQHQPELIQQYPLQKAGTSFQHLSRLAQSLELITQQKQSEIPCSPAWDFLCRFYFKQTVQHI